MNSTALAAFFDELTKISAIDLSGLGPEAVLGSTQPPPMPTLGYDKAKRVLDLAGTMKVAADLSTYEKVRRWGKPALVGAGSGALLGSMASFRSPKQLHRIIGAAIGAAVAVTDAALHKKATAPGVQLKNSRLPFQFKGVAKTSKMGPSLKSQTPLIGRLGTLPKE